MEASIRDVLISEITKHTFPGCVVGVIDRDGSRVVVAEGAFTYELDARPVNAQSIFDVASLTKTVPTAILALQLADTGDLSLDAPAVRYLTEWQGEGADQVLVRHLLSHTVEFCVSEGSGKFRLALLKDREPQEIISAILTTRLCGPPGETFAHTNAASILLGLIVERVSKKTLDVLAEERLFHPLQMTRTTFHPLDQFTRDEIVPTEDDPWRGRVIQGEVHDESAWKLSQERVVGSAGLFSTAPDLLTCLWMILRTGELQGTRYMLPKTVMQMGENQLNDGKGHVGLGWELIRPEVMGRHADKLWGKTGFTGCLMLVHQEMGRAMVMLSNIIYPKRRPMEDHQARINEPRRILSDIVFSSSAGSLQVDV